MSKRLHVKYPFCRILMKFEISRQISEKKVLNVKFHQNLSSGSRVVPCGQTDMKLTVTFRNSANAPKIVYQFTFTEKTGSKFTQKLSFFSSGAANSLAPGAINHNGHSLAEIMNFNKKSQTALYSSQSRRIC